MPSLMQTLPIVALAATSVFAHAVEKRSEVTAAPAAWEPLDCSPSYETYECDDEHGGSYTTVHTIFSKGCPGYTEWSDIPASTTSAKNTWEPVPKPTDPAQTWKNVPVDPAQTWKNAPVDPAQTWKNIPKPADPATTWEADPWKNVPKPTDSAKWSGWNSWSNADGKKTVTVTLIETYVVPCSTGWETKTSTVYVPHCGCTETPVPEHAPMSTYTTTCPESWGVGKTVTVTVPVEPTWAAAPVQSVDADSTWVALSSTPVDAASTWVALSSTPDAAQTWQTVASSVPVNAAATWSAASVTPVAAASTGPWSPVATWQGAASSTSVSRAMIVVAGAVAGLAFAL